MVATPQPFWPLNRFTLSRGTGRALCKERPIAAIMQRQQRHGWKAAIRHNLNGPPQEALHEPDWTIMGALVDEYKLNRWPRQTGAHLKGPVYAARLEQGARPIGRSSWPDRRAWRTLSERRNGGRQNESGLCDDVFEGADHVGAAAGEVLSAGVGREPTARIFARRQASHSQAPDASPYGCSTRVRIAVVTWSAE